MGDIGVPDSYEVWISDSLGKYAGSNPTKRSVAFTDISWQRIMNDTSSASVTVPRSSLKLKQSHFYPKPWAHSLTIFRNGYQVWSGPVMGWSRNADGDLVISAKDESVGMQKQFIGASRNFVNEEVSQVVSQVLIDAQVGVPGVAPVPMTIGAFYPLAFYPASNLFAGGACDTPNGLPIDATTTLQLDYTRFERVWATMTSLASQALLYFCCVNGHLYLNETGVRQQLAVGDTGWPELTDDNVVGVPTVNVDGLDSINEVARVAFPFEVQYLGHDHVITHISNLIDPVFTAFFASAGLEYLDGRYQYPNFDQGQGYDPRYPSPVDYLGSIHLQGDGTVPDQENQPQYGALSTLGAHAGPSVSVEKVQLSPTFSHPSLADDLSNLIPGTRFGIGFEDRSMFDVPFAERKLGVFPSGGARCGAVTVGSGGILNITPMWRVFPNSDVNAYIDASSTFDWKLGSLWSSRIDHLRLIQLDVSVSTSNGALDEVVECSFVPTIQYILKAYTGQEPVLNVQSIPPNTSHFTIDFPVRPRFVG